MGHEPFDLSWAHGIYRDRYAHPGEEWPDTAARVAHHVIGALYSAPNGQAQRRRTEHAELRLRELIEARRFIPGGRYLYSSGRDFHQTQNCLLMRAEDSREGWGELMFKATMALQTGAGIGVVYSDVRQAGAAIRRTGGVASGPVSLMEMVNEVGRRVMQGGARRSAIWAGLKWDHPDIFRFIRAKDWDAETRAKKALDFNHPANLDMTNISVILEDDFFAAYEDRPINGDYRPSQRRSPDPAMSLHEWAVEVYRTTLDKALTTAEPGFSIDCGPHRGENLRNACTEITSRDDSDVCNLGSVNLARLDSKEQFAEAVRDGTLFLLAGTLYSDLPYAKVAEVRERNRRLGLGVMGVHEWLLKRGRPYGPDDELAEWMDEYARATEWAHEAAADYGLSEPIATRAIAPNGTIGIIGETTTGCEPLFAAAYKREVKRASHDGDSHFHEYVIDPVAKRLLDAGHAAEDIEDAYGIDPERRIAFQAWLQRWVDQGISSTINLPGVVRDPDEQRTLGAALYAHLPNLRGITLYPNDARPGQPLERVPLEEAVGRTGVRYETDEESCVGGVCAL